MAAQDRNVGRKRSRSRRGPSRLVAVCAAVLVAAITATLGPSPAHAGPPIVVDTTTDSLSPGDGDCSLREAIGNVVANNESSGGDCATGSGTDIVVFDSSLAGATIVLTITGDTTFRDSAFGIVGPVVIDGSAAPGLSISGSGKVQRVFYVASNGVLDLEYITVTGGQAIGDSGNGQRGGQGGGGAGFGGAIYNDQGEVNIYASTFVGNSAIGGNGRKAGGGFCGAGSGGDPNPGAAGSPNFSSTGPAGDGGTGGFGGGGGGGGCSFGFQAGDGGTGGFGGGGGSGGGNNTGGGTPGGGGTRGTFGADGSDGTSILGGESGSGGGVGGAIFNNSGDVYIENSTFHDNLAQGGGVSSATLVNDGGGRAGAVMNYNGSLTVDSSTFSGNTVNDGSGTINVGGAIYSLSLSGGTAETEIVNSILANSLPAGITDYRGLNAIEVGDYNIMEIQSGWTGGPVLTGDPLLGSLMDNGGHTETLEPADGSPAINTGSTFVITDQRGVARPQGTGIDIGSVEVKQPDEANLLFSPCAIYNSQTATAAGLTGPLTSGSVRTVQVTGSWTGQGGSNDCNIPSDASAAIFKLEAVAPQSTGNLRLSEAGVVPAGGVVNYTSNGLNNSATVTVPLSTLGKVDVAANIGTTDVRLVAIGYYSPDGELQYTALTPCVVADSRSTIPDPPAGAFVGPFAAGDAYPDVDVASTFSANQGGGQTNCGVPTTAVSVMINVVSIGGTGGNGGLAIGIGTTEPTESTTNFNAIGLNNAAAGVVSLGPGGTIALNIVNFSGSPSTQVRLVVLGYFDDLVGQDYTAVNPCAAFDSRTTISGDTNPATGLFAGKRQAGTSGVNLTGVTTYDVVGPMASAQGGELDCGVPNGVTAVLINLVAIQPSATGNFRAYATGSSPTGGVLNFAPLIPAMNNSNAVVVPVSASGLLDLFVNAPSNDGDPTVHARGVILGYYL